MNNCPRCNTKQNGWKVACLGRYGHIECHNCKAKLKINSNVGAVIGFFGGGVAAFSAIEIFDEFGSILWWSILIFDVIAIIVAYLTLVKLHEIKT